jgi:hypothetical protein
LVFGLYWHIDCRPYTDYKKFESCVASIHGTMYIGIHGYVGGSYKLLAKESPPKAVLLHGLNSDVSTWNALKDKEFNDKCTTLPLSSNCCYTADLVFAFLLHMLAVYY